MIEFEKELSDQRHLIYGLDGSILILTLSYPIFQPGGVAQNAVRNVRIHIKLLSAFAHRFNYKDFI